MTNAEYCKQYKAKIKAACLALYGSRCVICGFDDPRALQIDHKASHPTKRQGEYGRGSTGLYLAILNGKCPKDEYQCLCANHNCIKQADNPDESPRHRGASWAPLDVHLAQEQTTAYEIS
jgi:hypothetical protein